MGLLVIVSGNQRSVSIVVILIGLAIPATIHYPNIDLIFSRSSDQFGGILGRICLIMVQSEFQILTAYSAGLFWLCYLKKKKDPTNRLVYKLAIIYTIIVAFTYLLQGRLSGFGGDSILEIISTNRYEALDFLKNFVVTMNPLRKEGLVCFSPLVVLLIGRISFRKNDEDSVAVKLVIICVTFISMHLLGDIYLETKQLLAIKTNFNRIEWSLINAFNQQQGDLIKSNDGPNIVVYIGESTSKWHWSQYGYPRNTTGSSLASYNDGITFFNNVISGHSHTSNSLLRAFSISNNVSNDQFIDDEELSRINVISLLHAHGVHTSWISNQYNGKSIDQTFTSFAQKTDEQIYLSSTVVSQYRSNPSYDHDMLPHLKDFIGKQHPQQIIFLHSYAGHWDYGYNIPLSYKNMFRDDLMSSLTHVALFGDLWVPSKARHINNLNQYDSAMHYVSNNLASAIKIVKASPKPTVLIYFSDHGEDVIGNTGHDSGRHVSAHVEVPVITYFNAAAKLQYPAAYSSAIKNSDAPYSLSWIADSLADLSGFKHLKRPWQSLFGVMDQSINRVSVLRRLPSGNRSVVGYDKPPHQNFYNSADPLIQVEGRLRSLGPIDRSKIWAHRADSLFKYKSVQKVFSGAEIDIVIDLAKQEVFVYHPPTENGNLTLRTFIELGGLPSKGLWLDAKNISEGNICFLREYINKIIPSRRKPDIIIESNLVTTDNAALNTLLALRRDGYSLAYSLPSYEARLCLDSGIGIEKFGSGVDKVFQDMPYDILSFDSVVSKIALDLKIQKKIKYATWNLSASHLEGIEDHKLLSSVQVYLVPIKTKFDH